MIFTSCANDFWYKIKMDNFDSYNVLLAIAINIPVLLMIAFGLQGHIAACCCDAPSVIVKAPCYFLKTMI